MSFETHAQKEARLKELTTLRKDQMLLDRLTAELFGFDHVNVVTEDKFLEKTGIEKDLFDIIKANKHIAYSKTTPLNSLIVYSYWCDYITFESLWIRGYITEEHYMRLMNQWDKECKEAVAEYYRQNPEALKRLEEFKALPLKEREERYEAMHREYLEKGNSKINL